MTSIEDQNKIKNLEKQVEKLKEIITSIIKMQNEIIVEQSTCERSSRFWAEDSIQKTNAMFSKLSEV